MSASCQIFFNPISRSDISENVGQYVDLRLHHDYEDDQDLVFSNYQCELSLNKLFDRYAERVSKEFLTVYSDIASRIDYTVLPMFVYDIQKLIGYMEPNGCLRIVDKTVIENSNNRSLIMVVSALC